METIFTEKLEYLLKNKDYTSLNIEEKKYVNERLAEEDFTLYSDLLKKTIANFKDENNSLILEEDSLIVLQKSFRKKHIPFYKKTMQIPVIKLQIAYYQSIAASIILIVGLFSVFNFNHLKNIEEDSYYLSDEEFNKYTQFDDYYVETEGFQIDDEVTQELKELKFTQ